MKSKLFLLILVLLYFNNASTQKKCNFGIIIGCSSKLRLGIPHDLGQFTNTTTEKVYPFEAFLNGGLSLQYLLNQKHILKADFMVHRMDINWKDISYTRQSSVNTSVSWYGKNTSYRFIQLPVTYNWVWHNKKLHPFIGIGIAPSYIISAENIIISGSSSNGITESNTYKYGLMGYKELRGIRRIKMPFVCEIGFKPFAHTIISLRSSLGIYIRQVGYDFLVHNPYVNPVYVGTQNNNMFSLLAKVYIWK